MSNWLHFIGRSFYSERQFLDEARNIGCSRRVALNVLKKMNFRDQVYCAMVRNNEKSPVILGYFTIDRLSGLSEGAGRALASQYSSNVLDFGGKEVRRGCGIYVTGVSYSFPETSLSEIVSALELIQRDGILLDSPANDPLCIHSVGTPLVQGAWTDIDPVIRLSKIKFRQGFRLLDAEKMFNEALESPRSVAKGHYYVFTPPARAIDNYNFPTEVQTLVSYRKFDKGDW